MLNERQFEIIVDSYAKHRELILMTVFATTKDAQEIACKDLELYKLSILEQCNEAAFDERNSVKMIDLVQAYRLMTEGYTKGRRDAALD